MVRQQVRNFGRPFYQAQVPGVEVVVKANIQGLLFVVNPVKIEMVNALAVFGKVFIYDRKGWTAYGFRNSQGLANCFNKSSFSGPHFSFEQYGRNSRVSR